MTSLKGGSESPKEDSKKIDTSNTQCYDTAPPTFPVERYYFGNYREYYAFGNTPAEDFLDSCTEREPSILSLGCGDIRSCFYTIWKHFDFSISDAPKRFDGVHFTLNDYSAAVLARNVVFLYLALKLPEDTGLRKKWLCGMWAIWYCHELYQNHQEMLTESLSYLIQFSDSLEKWASDENILKHLVRFTSYTCLADVSEVWKMWFNRTVLVSSVEHMKESRNELLKLFIKDVSLFCYNFSCITIYINGIDEVASSVRISSRASEVKSYLSTGNCFAENVLNLNLPNEAHSSIVNLTLYERKDGIYTLDYGSIPFRGYHQTFEFSPQNMASSSTQHNACVSSTSFEAKPFLANSVQQFAMWVVSANRVLKNDDISLSFLLNNQHALTFCLDLQQARNYPEESIKASKIETQASYSAIYTSNLMDHLGVPNLVLVSAALLKPNSFLFTTSMNCKNCASTIEEFLNICFGLNCQLLPDVLGLRCINHEGTGCASSVMIKPTPPDISHQTSGLPHVRILMWEKVSGTQALHFSQLPHIEPGNITDALVNLVGSSAFALLNHYPGDYRIVSYNGIETAILMLQQFISQLSNNSFHDYTYWEPLCSALKLVALPFLHCLQTQMLFHNIHAHLIVTENNCPLCKQIPLEDVVGLFCAQIPMMSLPSDRRRLHFFALVHKTSYQDTQHLVSESIAGGDVHIFDSFDGAITNNTLQLKFLAPLQFVKQEYQVRVQSTIKPSINLFESTVLTVLATELKMIQVPIVKYRFHQPGFPSPASIPQEYTHFGVVSSHVCNGYKTETEVSLSKSTLEALLTHEICHTKVSAHEIKFSCSSLTFLLSLNYPIDHNSVKFKLSKTNGTMLISCQRQAHSFDDEKPCYFVNPDHQLSIPPTKLSMNILKDQASMQMTKEECQALETCIPVNFPPMVRVKLILKRLFEGTTHCSFINLLCPDQNNIQGLIVVNKLVFDYQNRTPAIDLAFCFLENLDNSDAVMKKWERVIIHSKAKAISLDNAEFKLLRQAFEYFARRTNGNLQSTDASSKFFSLCHFKINSLFTRAVVYLLLCDPDKKFRGREDITQFPILPQAGGANCGNCGKLSFTMKKCTKCMKKRYCCKKCQTMHRPLHRHECKPASDTPFPSSRAPKFAASITSSPSKPGEQLSKCTYCASSPKNGLKKCTRCGLVQYCCKDCQRKHWPEHQKTCKSAEGAERIDCKEEESVSKVINVCTYCHNPSNNLKKCTKCGLASYCGRDCQRKHWPEHKTNCGRAEKKKPQDQHSIID